MTLAGSSTRAHRRRGEHRSGMRFSAFALIALALAIVASTWLATNRPIAFFVSLFVAANIAHKAAWSLWALGQRRVAGTMLLAMLAAIFCAAWILLAWFLEGGATPYFWAALALGTLGAGVAIADAIMSPDEDRGVAFEPRAPEDLSDFEVSAHGHEHPRGALSGRRSL